MLTTGITRKVDDLGRIVLPKELRDTLGFAIKAPVEVFVENNAIVFRKYEPGCIFCERMDELRWFQGRPICGSCILKQYECLKDTAQQSMEEE